jgi:uncharacterized protein
MDTMNARGRSRTGGWLAVTAAAGLMVGLVAGPVLAGAMAPRTGSVPQGADAQPAEHTIAVTGSGKVTVAPDMATIQLGVLVERTTAKEARAAAATAMNGVVAAIRQLGIADKDIRTSAISLNPVWDYPPNGAQRLRGYQLQNMVTVTVRNLDNLADVIDNGVAGGATSVNGITFDVADRAGAESKAREAAVRDARAHADTLATTAGVRITGVASISETVSAPVWYAPSYAAGAAKDAANPTPVMPGTTDVTINVSVAYLIS